MEKNLIGPHEGREFELLDEGKKHVAFFHDWIPDLYFEYKNKPEFGFIEWKVDAPLKTGVVEIMYVILYRKGHEQQANLLAEIFQSGYPNYFENGEKIERLIGQILSYPPDAIDYYVKRLRKRGRIK